MRSGAACSTVVLSIFLGSSMAFGQAADQTSQAAPPVNAPPSQTAAPATAAEELPAIDIVQETPAQKAVRKKKSVAVSPLTTTAPAAPAQNAGNVPSTSADIAGGAPITVPSAASTITDADIERTGTGEIQQTLQQQVPGIIVSDAAGNPLRSEVSFRGFDASPVSGRAQGLAVYQNGVRINEAFGDTVYWDVLPSNAIASMSVVSNNPSFGLNALGGAVGITMKDGFNYQGGEVDIMFGSFGRRQVGVQAGATSGNAAFYVAAEGIEDDGFRDFSDSEIKRFYGDIGLKGSAAEVHFNLTAASNSFGVTAAAPVELLDRSWSNTFTSPQNNDIEVFMPSISASVKATDTLSFSGVGYYRRFKNRVIDGNVTEIEDCGLVLCLEGEDVQDLNGDAIPSSIVDTERLGSIERLATTSDSWGGALEAQEKAKLFDRPNLFLAGVSFDHGRSRYKTSSEIGEIQPKYVVTGSGYYVGGVDNDPDDADELAPRDLVSKNTYVGLYFSNALDVTDQLTVTVGGRYNHATIKLEDKTGEFPGLNETTKYDRFNPMAGANYKLLPGLSLYGGYSESNRAPTPAELGCAEPEIPCLIESFLTDDPPLNQVVGRTAELGLRGEGSYGSDRFTWSAGLFRTLASDDILPVTEDNRIYFVNAGNTLRQGVELAATYETRKWNVYASYAFIDATLDKCTNPDDEGQCAFLNAGDRLPGVPRHRFKAGFDYWLTSKWKFGADVVAASNQPFFPNDVSREAEEDGDPLPALLGGYARVDLHTSYDVTERFQIYGLVKNLFDQRYGLYGTYFEADEVGDIDEELGGAGLKDARTISPSMPFAAYGGVKIKY
ncbi:MAG TPA: TonB-dependent receptor [Hyphomicrobium sp.]|nr:TonB-dependent receptor [Hyphomicrobium sp.]